MPWVACIPTLAFHVSLNFVWKSELSLRDHLIHRSNYCAMEFKGTLVTFSIVKWFSRWASGRIHLKIRFGANVNYSKLCLQRQTSELTENLLNSFIIEVCRRKCSVNVSGAFWKPKLKKWENLEVLIVCRKRLDFKLFEWLYVMLLQSVIRRCNNYTFPQMLYPGIGASI